jgi:hypothetical protein
LYIISALVGGFYHLETYEFVSWDDDYSQPDGKIIIHVPKHQPDENWGVSFWIADYSFLLVSTTHNYDVRCSRWLYGGYIFSWVRLRNRRNQWHIQRVLG